jgi:glycosyl transferase, group 4 family
MQLTNMQFIIFTMLIPCTISALFVYFVILFAKRHNLYDDVGGRKIHSGKIPRLGGIGFFFAFVVSVFITSFTFPGSIVITRQFTAIIIGGCLIFFMGLWDDLKNWRAIHKLIIQLIAAGIVAYAGFRFTRISFAPLGLFIPFGIFAYPITVLWVAGVTNAVNLMDGIDGQVGCLSVSLLISYIVLFFKDAPPYFSMIYFCIILAAAIIGFLFFNLSHPTAKIFMGDAGSQCLGFVLAILPLVPRNDGYETAAIPFAIIFMMLPIFDMIAAIWRRVREKRPIREGDRMHLHHKLMLIGYSPRGALVVVMTLQIIIDIFVTLAVISQGLMALVTLIGLLLVGILFFAIIHFEKEKLIQHDAASTENTQ